jgi:hypothetical protein
MVKTSVELARLDGSVARRRRHVPCAVSVQVVSPCKRAVPASGGTRCTASLSWTWASGGGGMHDDAPDRLVSPRGRHVTLPRAECSRVVRTHGHGRNRSQRVCGGEGEVQA